MHQNNSTLHRSHAPVRARVLVWVLARARALAWVWVWVWALAVVCVCGAGAGAGAAAADEQPNAAQLQPVRQLAAFMSTLNAAEHPTVFAARGLCIVENFAPYLFCGAGAAAAWEKGFRAHAAADSLTELQAHFDAAHDLNVDGNRAYFALPTVWTGKTHGRQFEEHGAWAFVLERHGPEWRILGYGWGVTSYTEAAH